MTIVTDPCALTEHNTLRLVSRAGVVTTIERRDQIESTLARANGARLIWLGGGSNVLLDEHVSGTVCLVRLGGVEITESRRSLRLRAMAGESWHALVRRALTAGARGLENLALIPGSVGAAPIQNIGAYGAELAEFLVEAEVVDTRTGEFQRLERNACDFGYRSSRFQREQHLLVVSVTLELPRERPANATYPDIAAALSHSGRPLSPRQVFEVVCRVRQRKLPNPRLHPNVGSFFKNPVVHEATADAVRAELPDMPVYAVDDRAGGVKLPAAALIDACGWKGESAAAWKSGVANRWCS